MFLNLDSLNLVPFAYLNFQNLIMMPKGLSSAMATQTGVFRNK